jgi:hypothetical protein
MPGFRVTAEDYPDMSWSPIDSGPGVDELIKALTAGTGADASAFTGGRALVGESLDTLLHETLYREKHVKLFKALRSSPLYATVDQYDVMSAYGSEWGMAMGETGNPELADPTIARMVENVKYYRDRREVSHVLLQTNAIAEPMAVQETAGTRRILGRVESDLFNGNPTIFAERIKGLEYIARAQGGDLVYDAGGAAVNDNSVIQYLAGIVANEGGTTTAVYHSPACQADIDQALQWAQRFVIPMQSSDGRMRTGASQRALATAYGEVTFEPDRFIRCGWSMSAPETSAGSNAPATPTISSVTGNTGAIYRQANLPAGDYYVRVSSVCETGESAAAAAEAVTLTAGSAIVINVADADADTTGFRVYVSAVEGPSTDCRFHMEIAKASNPQAITLNGTYVTGTTSVFVLDMDEADEALDFRQLFPLTRMDLAVVGPTLPFLLNFYGYMRAPKPNWHALIQNVLPTPVLEGGWNPLGA